MPTSFKSVHLPSSTIDAVRTMVSLPLLFPEAFSTGILKTHAMEGALLFGKHNWLYHNFHSSKAPLRFRTPWCVSLHPFASFSWYHPHSFLFVSIGTGKTLLARAIARESGARMMIIKPSDVMDMVLSLSPYFSGRCSHPSSF